EVCKRQGIDVRHVVARGDEPALGQRLAPAPVALRDREQGGTDDAREDAVRPAGGMSDGHEQRSYRGRSGRSVAAEVGAERTELVRERLVAAVDEADAAHL